MLERTCRGVGSRHSSRALHCSTCTVASVHTPIVVSKGDKGHRYSGSFCRRLDRYT